MKKVSITLVCVLMSSLTFAVGKDDSPKSASGMVVVRADESSYKVIYKSEEKSDVKVQIYNDQNALIYTDVIRHSNGFSRPYNFAKMAEGSYTIKLDNGSNWLSETVTYKFGSENKLAQLVTLGSSKYLLTVPGRGKRAITVTIFDGEGASIYTSRQPVDGDFAEVFDMHQVGGPFTMEVSDKKGSTKTFAK